VIGDDGRLAGVFSPGESADAATVGEMLRPADLLFDDAMSVAEAMERMRGFVGDAVPVIARDGGRYLGAVAEADVVAFWLDGSDRLRREENAAL